MSQEIKEAIELLKSADGILAYIKTDEGGRVSNSRKNFIQKALALLHPLAEPKCKTCGNTGIVGEEIVKYGRSRGFRECPDCRVEEPARLPKGSSVGQEAGLAKQLIVIATQMPYFELGGFDIKNIAAILIKAAIEIDRQAAELNNALQESRDRLVRADTLAAEKAELEGKIEYAKQALT